MAGCDRGADARGGSRRPADVREDRRHAGIESPPCSRVQSEGTGAALGPALAGGTDDRIRHQDNTFQDALPQAVICQADMFRPQVADL